MRLEFGLGTNAPTSGTDTSRPVPINPRRGCKGRGPLPVLFHLSVGTERWPPEGVGLAVRQSGRLLIAPTSRRRRMGPPEAIGSRSAAKEGAQQERPAPSGRWSVQCGKGWPPQISAGTPLICALSPFSTGTTIHFTPPTIWVRICFAFWGDTCREMGISSVSSLWISNPGEASLAS